MYLHTLPTTGALSFGDALVAPPGSGLGRPLARATELRAALRAVLKERKHGDDAERHDWLSVVKAVDDYLPYLFSIFNCVQTDDLLIQSEPEFTWRSTLSSSFLREPPRITLRGLHFELCSVLLLSATALSNLAVSTIASLGAYERDVSLTTDARKAHDDRLRLAADRLCTAAGIFEYLSLSLIPSWEATAGKIAGRAPDVTREVTMALSKLALADAETLAIRKLLSPFLSRATDTVTPGPPLPKTHPSASLLAKLTLNVSTLYASAHALALTAGKKAGGRAGGASDLGDAASSPAGSSKRGGSSGATEKMLDRLKDSASSGDGDIASGLLRYLSSSRDLARARAHKWLGIDAGEAGRYGDAIALLGMSRETLDELGGGGGARKSLKERGNRENKSALQASRDEELQVVEHWLKSYMKLNDTVGFQPVTKASEMQSRIPAGRAALAARRFEPPEPAFGPGSAGYLSEGMRRLGVGDAGGDGVAAGAALPADVAGVLRPEAKDQRRDYAGAGAYY